MGPLPLVCESKGTHTIDGYRKGGPCDFSDSEHYCSVDGSGDRVIQRVPRELTWVTKDYLT